MAKARELRSGYKPLSRALVPARGVSFTPEEKGEGTPYISTARRRMAVTLVPLRAVFSTYASAGTAPVASLSSVSDAASSSPTASLLASPS